MTRQTTTLGFALAIALSLSSFSAAQAQEASVSEQAQQAALWLAGSFDSSAQAAQDPDYFNVSLRSCLVSVVGEDGQAREDSVYLYVEQAIAGRELAPYRQRIYRIGDAPAQGEGVVESEIMTFTNPGSFVGFCAQAREARSLRLSELDERGCSVFLSLGETDQGEFRFTGRTPQGGCPSNFRGAVAVESFVSLGQNDLIAWDIGRDAAGNQVWGPEKGPYIFIRK